MKFHPGHNKLHFSLIFQKFREFATILRLSTFYSHLFALSVSVWYGNGYLIYIYKEECLSVRYAFSPCNSYRDQTFHDTSLGPEEGRHGVGITKKGQERGTWVKFHPDDLYIN